MTAEELKDFEENFVQEIGDLPESEQTDAAVKAAFHALKVAQRLAHENARLRERTAA